jgi:GMP synthase (glutamine-hydrolysing)
MSLDDRPTLLAVTNVPWETPHRILDSCGALRVRHVRPLEGDPLPRHEEVAGALVPGERKEIGFHEVTIEEPADPILGRLAPRTRVLHWHGDVFELPPGAAHLASSTLTAHQAFRLGNAWGVLFHPEADFALVERWMATPEMADEAVEALGEEGAAAIAPEAAELEAGLIAATTPGFEAFASLVAEAA